MVEFERAEKQKFLRDHVLLKGYIIEDFISYMQGLKGSDGTRLDR
jgi:hypothetical protein